MEEPEDCSGSFLCLMTSTLLPPCHRQTTNVYLTVSTTQSGRTAQYMGINQGHNIDPAYPVWYKRLGVNAVRLFGGDPAGETLPTFFGTASGRSLSGLPVKNYTMWKRAVSELR